MGTKQVLVSEWMDGTPLSRIISEGSKEDRDRAGILLVRFLFSGPSRAGLLHADPHPGNFRLLDDGQALTAAIELAERIAANGPLALIATKQIASGGADWPADQRWDQMAALMAPVFGSEDAKEGARAFAGKRPPIWQGR